MIYYVASASAAVSALMGICILGLAWILHRRLNRLEKDVRRLETATREHLRNHGPKAVR